MIASLRLRHSFSPFAVKVTQSSTDFSPFDLYSQKPRRLLNIVKETWEEPLCPHYTMISYVGMMQDARKGGSERTQRDQRECSL